MKNKNIERGEPSPPLYRADLFAAAKQRRGLSFRVVAGDLGLSINTVKSIVDGNSDSLDRIARLAEFYDLELIELFDTDGRIQPIA